MTSRKSSALSARALVHGLGRALGCGATLEELRRVKCGRLSVEDATPFMELVQLDAVAFKARVKSVFEARGR